MKYFILQKSETEFLIYEKNKINIVGMSFLIFIIYIVGIFVSLCFLDLFLKINSLCFLATLIFNGYAIYWLFWKFKLTSGLTFWQNSTYEDFYPVYETLEKAIEAQIEMSKKNDFKATVIKL